MTTVFLALLVIGLVLGVFAMLYGTEKQATHQGKAPHERRSEHDPAAEPSPLFNMASIAAFAFGAGLTGYLLTRGTTFTPLLVMTLSVSAGLAAFILQALLIARWAIPSARADQMDERYLLQGTLGIVTSAIPADGEGTMRYALDGKEYTLPARNFEPGAMDAGTEVVIERIENGIAYVELWAQVEQRL